LKNLGLCEAREGCWRLTEQGVTALDGELPINASGRVLCTNPIGASGMLRFAEAALQVRGQAGDHPIDGAEKALAMPTAAARSFSRCGSWAAKSRKALPRHRRHSSISSAAKARRSSGADAVSHGATRTALRMRGCSELATFVCAAGQQASVFGSAGHSHCVSCARERRGVVVNRQSSPLTSHSTTPTDVEAAAKARERAATIAAMVVMYGTLLWVCWPSLWFSASPVGDQSALESFRGLTLSQAVVQIGETWFRPGENLWFWSLAHSQSLVFWRVTMLACFLLTTLYVQYDMTVRTASYAEAFGAALGFSLNPSSLIVVCWLSAARVSLCAVGLLAYFACARRVLQGPHERWRDIVLAVAALAFALSVYELAMFAPLFILVYQRWHGARAPRSVVRWFHVASASCVAAYLIVQLSITQVLRFWAQESVGDLFASSMRYCMRNFYLTFNPFDTFGVLIPDEPGDHTVENIVCWVLMGMGFATSWSEVGPDHSLERHLVQRVSDPGRDILPFRGLSDRGAAHVHPADRPGCRLRAAGDPLPRARNRTHPQPSRAHGRRECSDARAALDARSRRGRMPAHRGALERR
jgi:hypothetical protein